MTLQEKHLQIKNRKASRIAAIVILFAAFLGALGFLSNANSVMCTIRLILTIMCLIALLFFYNKYKNSTSFQIRLPYVKGMVHSCDMKEFFKEKGILGLGTQIEVYNMWNNIFNFFT